MKNPEKVKEYAIDLIKESSILNEQEKDYWINNYDNMTQVQLLELLNIIILEKKEDKFLTDMLK